MTVVGWSKPPASHVSHPPNWRSCGNRASCSNVHLPYNELPTAKLANLIVQGERGPGRETYPDG